MLVSQRMGSYHGQDPAGLPFGYNDTIEGMAFPPDYRPRGPPPAPHGKPLLNLSDQERLDGFFAGFDSNSLTSNNLPTSRPGLIPGDALVSAEQPLTPQYFISSYSHMQGQPPFVDPNVLEAEGSMFNSGQMGRNLPLAAGGVPLDQLVQHTPQALPFANYQTPHNNGHQLFDSLSTSTANSYPVLWRQNLPSTDIHSPDPRPSVRFGSDSHFRSSGYVPPLGSADLADGDELRRLEWLEADAQSSTPNTQPNTEPSSPVWTRKTKAEATQSVNTVADSDSIIEHGKPTEQQEMTADNADRTSTSKRRKVSLRTEADLFVQHPQSHSSSIAAVNSNPGTRGKRKSLTSVITTPTTVVSSPTQRTQPSKPSQCPSNSSKPKPKRPPAVSSNSASSGGVGAARVPLTSDQKRANHTNSEQRRRDQAQKAFAQLFDLVPELEHEGKLSQMKKLERVVSKIRELEEGNQECRRRIDQVSGVGKNGDAGDLIGKLREDEGL